MRVSEDQVRVLLALQRLSVPEDDLPNIALRLSIWLTALEEVERDLGDRLYDVDPVPPVYPKEPFA